MNNTSQKTFLKILNNINFFNLNVHLFKLLVHFDVYLNIKWNLGELSKDDHIADQEREGGGFTCILAVNKGEKEELGRKLVVGQVNRLWVYAIRRLLFSIRLTSYLKASY